MTDFPNPDPSSLNQVDAEETASASAAGCSSGPALENGLLCAWQTAAQRLGLTISETAPYLRLYQAIVEYNRRLNLTRITEPADFFYRHLLESLALATYLPKHATVLDMGTGGGFPALPLAIYRPDLAVTAVDSVQKKCAAVADITQQLGLGNLRVCPGRSEDLGQQRQYRQKFMVVTARAVAPLPVLLELTLPFLAMGGQLLALKSTQYATELAQAERALKLLGGAFEEAQPLAVTEGYQTVVLRFSKVQKTPAAYPRRAGVPSKNPL
ncbi:MAG: 16S rRNA (guanine(527)-N(7))-methyltransferase RsmG [Candidatus Melainabacteria bacterium]|nr:16S rRNA (guanine(527)-N(7))-methyltransferase RsmG [Candidatus Melainabacteria bacterium]